MNSKRLKFSFKYFFIVKNTILQSNKNEIFSNIKLKFCCQDNKFKTFSWAQPVIPGFT